MESILTNITVSMSELKKNPAAVLRDAKNRPVAVLNHNRVAFYMIEPQLFEAMIDEIADKDLGDKVLSRLAEKFRMVDGSIENL